MRIIDLRASLMSSRWPCLPVFTAKHPTPVVDPTEDHRNACMSWESSSVKMSKRCPTMSSYCSAVGISQSTSAGSSMTPDSWASLGVRSRWTTINSMRSALNDWSRSVSSLELPVLPGMSSLKVSSGESK